MAFEATIKILTIIQKKKDIWRSWAMLYSLLSLVKVFKGTVWKFSPLGVSRLQITVNSVYL